MMLQWRRPHTEPWRQHTPVPFLEHLRRRWMMLVMMVVMMVGMMRLWHRCHRPGLRRNDVDLFLRYWGYGNLDVLPAGPATLARAGSMVEVRNSHGIALVTRCSDSVLALRAKSSDPNSCSVQVSILRCSSFGSMSQSMVRS
uniref:Uncharacterized protein n=1 Tax=Anopheles melas TaxID=34690 RepID=A0A182TDS1_9DIPT